ncbi:hypothetical protein BASA81_009281 [Batrachochytrium salamandrivorans]|nr:hypothetical protein BASA81_009281 [Batrachochytrium salamandrivorans]
MTDEETHTKPTTTEDEVEASPDVHFEPVVKLEQLQEIMTFEENETRSSRCGASYFALTRVLLSGRSVGTGDVKFLKHKETGKIRLLMRRDKTHKICANHFALLLTFQRTLLLPELLAIRFANSENANKFKDTFEDAKKSNAAQSRPEEASPATPSKETPSEEKAAETADADADAESTSKKETPTAE